MVVFEVFASSIGAGIMTLGYALILSLMAHYRSKFARFPIASCQIVINGGVGIIGYALYCLNATIGGLAPPRTVGYLVTTQCTVNCDEAYTMLLAFAILSTLRFLCWYIQAWISTFFILERVQHQWTFRIVYYSVHTINVIFSLVTFIMAIVPAFPSDAVAGSRIFSPIVAQSLSLVWAWMSYYFVAKSRLYRL